MHDIASDDYYRVLGVARTATSVEIEAAYRELAITYHPGNSMGSKLSAEADFNIVGEAYSVLSNADTREIYDRDGRDGLGAGAQPMTKERAMEIFDEFFRFGEAMDPDAPDLFKGLKRAAGGAVYAPAKGLLYGGKSIMGGVIMGSAAIVAGTGAIVANIGLGIIEMGEAGINAARQREHNEQASYGETETPVTTAENESVNHKPTPSFLGGLKKATVDAVAAPVAALVTSGSVVLASGAAASGYVAGGFVGAASNVASGVHEVKAASKKEMKRRTSSADRTLDSSRSPNSAEPSVMAIPVADTVGIDSPGHPTRTEFDNQREPPLRPAQLTPRNPTQAELLQEQRDLERALQLSLEEARSHSRTHSARPASPPADMELSGHSEVAVESDGEAIVQLLRDDESIAHGSVSSSSPLGSTARSTAGQGSVAQSNDECVICLDAAQEAVCVPCGHNALCMNCAQELLDTSRLCPVCRQQVREVIRLYRV